jgi:hypothetical protein
MIMTKQYSMLAEKYSPEELADSFVFPSQLTKKQKKEADNALSEILKQRRTAMSPEYQLKGILLQLRFQILDYLNDIHFDKHKTFGYFLKLYIDGLKKRRNEFAHEINIKPTELSQYINNHRKPPTNIMVRLELHSHNMIPATDWYRLLEKENLHELSTNKLLRQEEKKFIKRVA